MDVHEDFNPLSDDVPTEIPLKNAPLVRVVAQVKFPVIASLGQQAFIASFQEAIRNDYPLLRPEQNQGVIIGTQGVVQTDFSTVWRFHDAKSKWRISLATDFVAVEALNYSNREAFLERFEHILRACEKSFNPGFAERLGVRYIDRIKIKNIQELQTLIRPEVAGTLNKSFGSLAQYSLCENMFVWPESGDQLKARWGVLPPKATVDPAALEPIEEQSWILDLDMVNSKTREFETAALVNQSRKFAERIYSFFRWAVTSQFLRRYGGE